MSSELLPADIDDADLMDDEALRCPDGGERRRFEVPSGTLKPAFLAMLIADMPATLLLSLARATSLLPRSTPNMYFSSIRVSSGVAK